MFTFAQGVGYIQIKGDPGANVFLDNKPVGKTHPESGSLILKDVPAGTHELKFVKEGYQPHSEKIDLKPNEVYFYEVSLKPKTGALLIETVPVDCIIEIPQLGINQVNKGNKTERYWEISVPIGKYSINFTASGKKVKYDLEIEEGARKYLLFDILHNKTKEIPRVLTWLWDKTYGGSSGDLANSIIQTTDGGFAVAGNTFSKGDDYYGDAWIIKLNNQGNIVWDRTYGGKGYDWANSIIQTTDGGFAVAGESSISHGAWIIKLDSKGNIAWDTTYSGGKYNYFKANCIIQTTDGGYAVAGSTGALSDVCITKLDSQGNIVWDRTYGGSDDDEAHSIIQTTDGGFMVAGFTRSKGSGRADFWIIKLDSKGTLVWDRTYGGSIWEEANSIIQTTDGGFALAGWTTSKGSGGKDFWIIKLDSKGTLVWDRTYGGSYDDEAHSLIQTTDGGFMVAGFTTSKGAGKSDFWIIKLDSKGTLVWDRTYGGSYEDEAHSLIQSTDGGFMVAGSSKSKGAGWYDVWIIKLDERGNLVLVLEDLEPETEVKATETQSTPTTHTLQGSLHCPDKAGYACPGCLDATGYINHFKGFNILTAQEDCYVRLVTQDSIYIGNHNDCVVIIKGEKWLGLEDESGVKITKAINEGKFNFAPTNKFAERTMNFPKDHYQYEFADAGKEFRLYLSRDVTEAFQVVPWRNLSVEIKNQKTNKVFTYQFEKGIFPRPYIWPNGVANYGQCVWWAAKRWVEEVDSQNLFPFYPLSPQTANVKTIDLDYKPKQYDILIDYIPGGQPGHYGFVEKVEDDLLYITQFNFIPPGEVYNSISRFWNKNPKSLYYSLNPSNEYYFKYYYRR